MHCTYQSPTFRERAFVTIQLKSGESWLFITTLGPMHDVLHGQVTATALLTEPLPPLAPQLLADVQGLRSWAAAMIAALEAERCSRARAL
jgi:hypothetical protein